ncbi:MAG: tetratricopeptide repeat protein [Pseudomonadota bacterium]|nr:tetratricopeptide repeat protein [Pseudomonadota bacterium]
MPSDTHNHLQEGAAYHRAGDFNAAKAKYQAALAAAPGDAKAWHLMGQLLHGEGDLDRAIFHVAKALEIDPALPGATFNLAILYEEVGNASAAETLYLAHVKRAPKDAAALFELARLQQRSGQRDAAVENYRRLLDLDPDHLAARINLGAGLNELGRFEEAVAELDRALELAPNDPGVLNNLGLANQAIGRHAAAHGYLLKAHDAEPGNPVIAANLARVGLRLGKYVLSLSILETALKKAPNEGPLRVLNALALPYIAESEDAVAAARARLEEAIARLENLELRLENPLGQVGMTNFLAVYHGLDDRPLQDAIAHFYARNCADLLYTAPHCKKPHRPRGKTKIGFASAHLGSHTIGKLNRELINGLNRDRFDVHVFSLGGSPESTLAAPVYSLPTDLAGAREVIAEANLDILYYPDIGMDPMSYFLGFARLAPVQCVTWGHPVTTGLPTMDFYLSNRMAEPKNAQLFYSECLLLSDRLDVCYARPAPLVEARSRNSLGLSENTNLYLCAQSLFKVHPQMDAAFGAILGQDPKAEILFIDGQQESWSAALKNRFENTVPDAGRIRFLPRLAGAEFSHLIAAADVLLDTFPFSGGNTSFEALAQGKPIITLPGNYFSGRFTYALFRQMDILETVAQDAEDYAHIAVALACEEDRRHQLKTRILEASDTIFETRDFIGERETLLEELLARRIS